MSHVMLKKHCLTLNTEETTHNNRHLKRMKVEKEENNQTNITVQKKRRNGNQCSLKCIVGVYLNSLIGENFVHSILK